MAVKTKRERERESYKRDTHYLQRSQVRQSADEKPWQSPGAERLVKVKVKFITLHYESIGRCSFPSPRP